MIPCYQLCKDRGCPRWNVEMMDCDKFPDDCEFAVEHLVEDRENQLLDGKQHGYWSNGEMFAGWYEDGNLKKVKVKFQEKCGMALVEELF